MYLAIYKDTINNIMRYYYEENDNIYYDEYSKNGINKYKLNSLYGLYKLFSKDDNSKFIGKKDLYDIYVDSNNYRHYIKDGQEDFIKYFENNGVDALLYDNNNDEDKSNDFKKKFVKKLVIGSAIIVVSVSLFYRLSPYIVDYAVKQIRKADSYEEFVENIDETVTDEEILNGLEKCFKNLDSFKSNMIINSNIIPDILKYYNDVDKSYLYEKKLKNLEIKYVDSSLRSDINGAYNELSPGRIYIIEDIADNFEFENKVFFHEFVHLLQNRNISNYLTEPVAELMSTEYFGLTNSNYLDEVNNLKLLICTVGKEPVLKYSIGADDSELLEILKNNLDEEDYYVMTSMLSRNMFDYGDNAVEFNKDFRRLIKKLYLNMYGESINNNTLYNLILHDVDCEEFIEINDSKYDVCFNIEDNRLYLKDSDNVSTITFNMPIDSNFDISAFEDSSVKNIENTKYYRKKLNLEEYHYYERYTYPLPIVTVDLDEENYCNEYYVGDDGEVYAYYMIDGEKKQLSFDEMYNLGIVTYYLYNEEKDIKNLNDYEFAFETKKVTLEVEPIVNTKNNTKNK